MPALQVQSSATLESKNGVYPWDCASNSTISIKEAMKAKDVRRVSTLRLVLSALKDRDIANRTEDSRDRH